MRKLLPIGSVVMLTGGTKEVMITGYKSKTSNDGDVFDYNGCIFPEGFMENKFLLFNHSQIKEILFTGYENEEYKKYLDKINQMLGTFSINDNDKVKSKNGNTSGKILREPTKPMSKSEMKAKFSVKKPSCSDPDVKIIGGYND